MTHIRSSGGDNRLGSTEGFPRMEGAAKGFERAKQDATMEVSEGRVAICTMTKHV